MVQDVEILIVQYSLQEGPLLGPALQRLLHCGPLSQQEIVRYRTYLCSQNPAYRIFEDACGTGDVPILQWLVKRHSLIIEELFEDEEDIYWGVRQAATNGHLHVLQWLKELGLTVKDVEETQNYFPAVARNGHLHVLHWLKDLGVTFTNDPDAFASAFFGAQHYGHAAVVKWFESIYRESL